MVHRQYKSGLVKKKERNVYKYVSSLKHTLEKLSLYQKEFHLHVPTTQPISDAVQNVSPGFNE